MTQQNWNGPAGPTPRGAAGKRGSRTILWVVIAAAAVVLVGLVVWGLASSGEDTTPTPLPTTKPVEPTTAEPEPTATDTQPGPEDSTWGPFPPPNLGELRDLSNPNFPQTLGATFVLTGTQEGMTSVSAEYDDTAQPRALSVMLWGSRTMYATVVADMDDPSYHGNAVCGQTTDGAFVHTLCVMGAESNVLELGSASDTFTVEEMAALAQELYEAI